MSGLIHHAATGSSLVSGLGPFTLAAIAFSLVRADRQSPWRWLVFFALGLGLREWMGALPAGWVSTAPLAIGRSVVSTAALLALLEFARRTLGRVRGRELPSWTLAAVAGPMVLGMLHGYALGPAGWALALSAVAGCSAAVALWRAAGEEPPLVRRWLRLSGLAIGACALLSGVGGGPWASWGPAAREVVALGAAALLLIFALWNDAIGEHGVSRWRATLAVAGATGLLLALVIASLLRGPAEARWAHHGIPVSAVLTVLVCAASFGLWTGLLASWRAAAEWANWTRRQSRNLLTSITESIGGGLLAVDGGGQILYQNARFAELWSLPSGFMLQGDVRILLGFLRDRAEDPEAFIALTERALYSSGPTDETFRLKDGRVFRLQANGPAGAGEGLGRVFHVREVTESTRAESERLARESRRERQSEGLATLAQRLTPGDPEASGLSLRELCEVAAAVLEVEQASVWLRDGDGEALRCVEFHERFPDPAVSPQRVAAYADFFLTLPPERAAAVDEAREDPRTRDAWERHAVLRDTASLLQSPIEGGGRLVGVLSLARVGVPRRWLPDEQRFATAAAALIAAELDRRERLRSRQEAREARALQALTLETAACALYQTDASGRIVAVNGALCRMTGHLPEDLIGQSASILGDGVCGSECQLAGAGLSEPLLRHPCWASDRHGRRIDIVRSASPIVGADGRAQGTMVSFLDVTEAADARRQGEEALRMAQRAQGKLRTAQARVEALEAELARVRGGAEEREREGREARDSARALQEQLRTTAEERDAARTDLADAREQLGCARSEVQELRARSEVPERELRRAEDELARLRAELESANAERSAAQEEVARARARSETPERELRQAGEELARLRTERASALEQRDALRGELARAQEERDAARGEMTRAQAASAAVRGKAESAQRELEAAREETVALNRRLAGLQEEVERAKAERAAKPVAPRAPIPLAPHPSPRKSAAKAVAPPTASSAVDFAALLSSVGGDRDMAARRVRAFQKGVPWMVARLRQAAARKNGPLLLSAAESLRRALSDVAARDAERRAGQLEAMARQQDLTRLAETVAGLESDIERVSQALAALPKAA